MRIKILGNLRTRWSVLIALATSLGLTTISQTVQAQPFKDRKVNINLPVGTIAGSHGVANGAATYSIPIPLPPGTDGFVPSLSVNYNSQATNGLLGFGWNISGISSITRRPKNYYNDGKVGPVKLASTDILALNGNRLVAVNGVHGEEGTVYAQEVEQFNKITSFGKAGYKAPKWFKVETKKAITMEYGRSDDSRIAASGQNPPLSWMLNKVYDNYGNHYTYHYRSKNNETLLDKIKYNDNVIQFNYGTRKDKNKTYVAGQRRSQNVILKSIVITNEGNLVDRYEFKHELRFYSYLTEIIRYGSKFTPLNSTVFKYGENDGNSIVQEPVSNVSTIIPSTNGGYDSFSESYKHWTGDFNGDGKTDILKYGEYSTTKIKEPFVSPDDIIRSSGKRWYVHFGKGNNGFESPIGLSINIKLGFSDRLEVADFNGDGMDDIVFVLRKDYSNANYKDWYNRKYLTFLSKGKGFSQQTEFFTGPFEKNKDQSAHHLIDVDGDGKLEMFDHIEGRYWLVFNGNRYDPKTKWEQWVDGKYNFSESFLDDFDGDGSTEIINVYDIFTKKYYYASWNGSAFSFNEQKNKFPIPSGRLSKDKTKYLYGDFNGDGKLDYITAYLKNPFGASSFYPGTGNINTQDKTPIHFDLKSQYAQHLVKDINGDGKSDIIAIHTQSIDVYYSSGLKFHRRIYGLPFKTKDYELTFGDFNGDGVTDIYAYQVYGGSSNKPEYKAKVLYFPTSVKGRLLHAIADGYNNVTEFTYDFLTSKNVYKKGVGSKFPVNDIQPALPVVSFVSIPNGMGNYGRNTTAYLYEGAKLHKQGKGFLGYEKITETNYGTGIKTETKFRYHPKYFLHQAYQTKAWLIGTGQQLSQTNLWNRYKDLGSKRVWPYLLKSKSDNKLLDFVTITDFKYDNYGNLRWKREKNPIITSTEVATHERFGTHIPASVTYKKTSTQRNNQSPYVREIEFKYYPTGKVKQIITDPKDKKKTTTYHVYDNNNGTLKMIVLQAEGMKNRVKMYDYDAQGRFIEKTTNSLNQSSYTTYDTKRGLPLTTTGIDGLKTTFEYNEFGQLIKQTTPDNITTTTTMQWDITSGDPQNTTELGNAMHSVTVATQGKPTVKTWFDALGRNIQKQTDGFTDNDPKIYQVTTYDYRGRVKTVTNNFFKGSSKPIIVTHNSYNNMGQLEKSSNSIGTVKYRYKYRKSINRIVTYVTNLDGTESRTDNDATGKLIASKDESGKFMNYSYYSSGLLKETRLAGKVIATAKYDLQGNQTELMDLNAGTTNYISDAFGQVIHMKDAAGNTFEMQYDVLGRTKQKTDVGTNTITTYNYVSSGNGINQLEKVVESKNNISEQYGYDYLGRVKSVTETIDGKNFVSVYGYNKYNAVDKVTYPSGFSIENIYTNTGHLDRVISGSKTLWNAEKMNENGQYTKYNLGNGLTTHKLFDDYGYPKHFVVSNPSVQNLKFKYDPKNGNLLSRSENGKMEVFDYDDLDRLKFVQLNGQLKQELKYWDNGNIEFKTDAGEYTYDKNKVNAVLTATNPNGDISSLEQNIKYNSFHSPESISETETDDNGNPTKVRHQLSLYYGPNQQRKKTVYVYEDGKKVVKKYFLGEYEKTINYTNGKHTEVHYIAGGDGLAAVYVKKSGSNGQLYYAYTDQLSSTTTLTDEKGKVVYQQSFDAWGRKRSPKSWEIEDYKEDSNFEWLRGYTGHEHLPEFGLINMNGRVYDPVLGRMLSADNYVQNLTSSQSYNRYSYCLNNPLKYNDPDGEIPHLAVVGIYAAVNVGADWAKNDFQMNGDQFARSLMRGMVQGSYAAASGGVANGWDALGGALCDQIPEVSVTIGSVTVGISPAKSVGNGFGYGANMSVKYNIDDHWSVSGGFGITKQNKAMGSGLSGIETRTSFSAGYDNGKHGFRLYSTTFGGNVGTNQRVGGLEFKYKDFSVRYENDGAPFNYWSGDGGDRYRTAAVQLSYLDYTAGFRLFTGSRKKAEYDDEFERYGSYKGGERCYGNYNEVYPNDLVTESGPRYRLGGAYVGYKNFQIGANSEWIRHGIQDRVAHGAKAQPGFEMLSNTWKPYFNYQTFNPFTLW